MHYSYRNAVMGSIFAALRAGYHPKNMLVVAQTEKDTRIEPRVVVARHSNKLETDSVIPIPEMTPMVPPVMLIIIDSAKNCRVEQKIFLIIRDLNSL